MRFRTWPVVALALLGLLALIVVSILAAQRKADAAYAHLDSLNSRYRDVETRLRRVRSGLHLSGILARDYLLDTTTPAADYRSRLVAYHVESEEMIAELEPLLRETDLEQYRELRRQLDEYWHAYAPLFDGTHSRSLWLSAPRDRAAARRGHADLRRDRGDQQPHTARPAAGGGRAPARAAPVPDRHAAGEPHAGPGGGHRRRHPHPRARRALRGTAQPHAAGRRRAAAAFEPARAYAGGGAQGALARAARRGRADADGAAHGDRPRGAGAGASAAPHSRRPWPRASRSSIA